MRQFTSLATLAIVFQFGTAQVEAIEVVWGEQVGFNQYGIFGRDVDDPASPPRQIAGAFSSPIIPNGLQYWEGKIYARTMTGPMDVAEYEIELDGSESMPANNVPTRVGFAFQGLALTLDGSAGYYVDTQVDRVVRQDLDEFFEPLRETTVVETDDLYLADIALDERNGKIYWFAAVSAHEGGIIQRANFDGTGLETLVDFNDGLNPDYSPVDLALDVAGGKMYWSTVGQVGIRRANLDGSDIEIIVPNAGYQGFALIVEPVPEPASWLLALAALASLVSARPSRA